MRKECGYRVKKWPTTASACKYGYLRNEAIIRKTPNSFWSDHDTEPVSMTSLSRSCATSRLEPWTDTHTHTHTHTQTTTVTLAHARRGLTTEITYHHRPQCRWCVHKNMKMLNYHHQHCIEPPVQNHSLWRCSM